ncbi:hypothetical protein D3C73_1485470 [compost metagenome]
MGASLLAMRECQSAKFDVTHRYREQARSHRFNIPSSRERNTLHHLQVIPGQARILERRAQVSQLADAQVLQNLRACPHFRIDA